MMAVIGDDPVLWVDTKTTRRTGDYGAAEMRMFNQALAKAHARYPGLKVYAWSDAALDDLVPARRDPLLPGRRRLPRRADPGGLAEAFPAG